MRSTPAFSSKALLRNPSSTINHTGKRAEFSLLIANEYVIHLGVRAILKNARF
jgi:hypothetical protein